MRIGIAAISPPTSTRGEGDSHYGLSRIFHVLFDILTIRFLLRYFTRPMHFFGSVGLSAAGWRG